MSKGLKIILFFLLFVSSFFSNAETTTLSNKVYISLITCTPGDNLYEAFGHSALRVYDPIRRIDKVYNYGTFDFNQPNFYSNFAKGNLNYMLGVGKAKYFFVHYVRNNRTVYEDVLNLTQAQKQLLYEYLEHDALPENRVYSYNYFYNNCSTKIRDALKEIIADSIWFDAAHITTKYTIRELVDLHIGAQPWGDFGIDIALGLPMDKVASPYEYMYLPKFLKQAFEHAKIIGEDTSKPLIKHSRLINESTPEKQSPIGMTPAKLFWLLFILTLALTFYDFKKQKKSRWFDVSLFGLIGLMGCVLGFISFFTDHKAAANNFNLLWALPLHLPAAFLLLIFSKAMWLKTYFLVTAILCILLMLTNGWLLPQLLHYSLIPLWLTITIRALFIWRS